MPDASIGVPKYKIEKRVNAHVIECRAGHREWEADAPFPEALAIRRERRSLIERPSESAKANMCPQQHSGELACFSF
jgi:hypothetical protein